MSGCFTGSKMKSFYFFVDQLLQYGDEGDVFIFFKVFNHRRIVDDQIPILFYSHL